MSISVDPVWVATIAAVVSAVFNVIQFFQNKSLKNKVNCLSATGDGNIVQRTSDQSTAIAHANEITVNHGNEGK